MTEQEEILTNEILKLKAKFYDRQAGLEDNLQKTKLTVQVYRDILKKVINILKLDDPSLEEVYQEIERMVKIQYKVQSEQGTPQITSEQLKQGI